RKTFARRPQRGADLLGMVAVIVDDEDLALVPLHLEASMDAAELFEGMGGDAEGDLEIVGDRERGERVEGVMPSGHVETHVAEPAPAAPRLEGRRETGDAQLARLPLG